MKAPRKAVTASDASKIKPSAEGGWVVKQEPESYSWTQFCKDKRTAWTGVRNFQSRNNLIAMKKGDRVLYYHSVTGKAAVGIAEVVRTSYPDPTAEEGDWTAVDLKPIRALKRPVTLQEIKADPQLKDILLVRNSRISVSPLTAAEFERIVAKEQRPGAVEKTP